jgi:hypothetical protein
MTFRMASVIAGVAVFVVSVWPKISDVIVQRSSRDGFSVADG